MIDVLLTSLRIFLFEIFDFGVGDIYSSEVDSDHDSDHEQTLEEQEASLATLTFVLIFHHSDKLHSHWDTATPDIIVHTKAFKEG